jgi:hypothetical protein
MPEEGIEVSAIIPTVFCAKMVGFFYIPKRWESWRHRAITGNSLCPISCSPDKFQCMWYSCAKKSLMPSIMRYPKNNCNSLTFCVLCSASQNPACGGIPGSETSHAFTLLCPAVFQAGLRDEWGYFTPLF